MKLLLGVALLVGCSNPVGPSITPEFEKSVHASSGGGGGGNVVCSSSAVSNQCRLRYIGAGLILVAVPEACTTAALCGAALAGFGLAYNDYLTYPDPEPEATVWFSRGAKP